jgi:hypothetical protein
MPNIYLYAGEANPKDVKLSDPTVQRATSGAITGTVTGAQARQTEAIAGTESFAGSATGPQKGQTEAIAGTEAFAGTVSEAQARQTGAVEGSQTFAATASTGQARQAGEAIGSESFDGKVTTSQAVQAEAITAFTGTAGAIFGDVATSQARQEGYIQALNTDTRIPINLTAFAGWKPMDVPGDILGSVDGKQRQQSGRAKGSTGTAGYSRTAQRATISAEGHVGRDRKARERELLEIMAA